MYTYLSLLVVFLVGVVIASEDDVTPTVHIGQGKLKGVTETSRGGREYNVFYGIPFGKVEKRFEMSKPADGWSGIRIANKQGASCINSGLFGPVGGSEDCLFLDVYTPNLPSNNSDTQLLPVMVWIYGGGFVEGSKDAYRGGFFMDEDVILVLINYRLGVFGFLNAGVKDARGNQGMKDQVLALRWVRDNIAQFSGDKDKVTIFGESAGAVSVSLLTVSLMAEGLFHRAIMQSGTAAMPFFYHGVNGPDLAVKLGREVDCPTSNMQYLVECLRRLDIKVLAPLGRMINELGFDESAINMSPSYETYTSGDDDNDPNIFLSEDPYELAKRGAFTKVPMIIGLTAFECYASAASLTIQDRLMKKVNHQWGRVGPKMLFLSQTAEDPALASQAVRNRFLQGRDVSVSTLYEYEAIVSERHLIHPFRVFAELYAKHAPVYLYNFTQMVPIVKHDDPNMAKYFPSYPEGQTRRVAAHMDEIPYQFDISGAMAAMFQPIGKGHEDEEFSKQFVATWTTFADTGIPNGPWGEWTPFAENTEGRKWLHIENSPKLKPLPHSWEENKLFWNGLNLKEFGGKWKSEL